MKLVDIEQGTPEWLEWRKSRRMASESPAVMGMSPYGNANKIRKDKQGTSKGFQNKAMAYGHEQEVYAREFYEKGHQVMIPHCAEDDDGIYGASFDGISIDNKRILEIKSPYHGADSDRWRAALEGKLLPHDFIQVQHQLMVSEADSCDFIVWAPDEDMQIINVKPEPEEWEKIREAWDEFWPTIVQRDDKDWAEAADSFRSAKAEYEAAKAKMDDLKEQLIAMAGNQASGRGVSVSKINRKGSIDWAKVQSSLLPDTDLEPYRKKDSSFYRVDVEETQ